MWLDKAMAHVTREGSAAVTTETGKQVEDLHLQTIQTCQFIIVELYGKIIGAL